MDVSCVSDTAMAELFLDLAKTHYNHADGLFKTFITVLFSSFAFASGFPMGNLGKKIQLGQITLGFPSVAVAFVLASFYLITFLSFRAAVVNSQIAASTFVTFYEGCNGKGKDILGTMFNSEGLNTLSSMLPQIGFVLGSIMGVSVFLFLANSERKAKS